MINNLALMTGVDIPIPECQLILHQPTIKEISMLGEKAFFTGIQLLTINKTMISQDKQVLDQITNFQVFMTIMQESHAEDQKKAVHDVLTLLFPKYKINFSPRSIVFKLNEENFIIDEKDFENFQQILSAVFNLSSSGQQSYNPGNKAAKAIADKLMKARERAAAQKEQAGESMFGQYLSILTVGLHLPLSEILNFTMYQMYDIVERYMLWVSWDLDIKARLAGAKADHKVDNWMKPLHSQEKQ